MNTKRATSRRAILSGAVVSALAGAAAVNVSALASAGSYVTTQPLNLYPVVYPSAPDPIYKAVEDYWRAYDRWIGAFPYTDVSFNHPEHDMRHALGRQLNHQEKLACDAVAACVPTTKAGLLVYLRFFENFEAMSEYSLFETDAEELVATILKTVRVSLENMEIVA